MTKTTRNGHQSASLPVDTRGTDTQVQHLLGKTSREVSETIANIKTVVTNQSADIKELCENAVKMTEGKDSHVAMETECQFVERINEGGNPERIYSTKLSVTIDGEYPQHRR